MTNQVDNITHCSSTWINQVMLDLMLQRLLLTPSPSPQEDYAITMKDL